ncbi:MAG: CPBP family intramembrane metalloprotease, partial [Rhodobacteraceae bacterium]|nr:CPBP family intramembrane metalloprotease [Paracoccaceae bacterium]
TLVGVLPGLTGGLVHAPVPQVLASGLLLIGIRVFRWSDTALGAPVPGTARLMWLPWLYLALFGTGIVALGGVSANRLAGLAAVMIWVALSEELMFRALLYPALRRRMRPWGAIWLTSLLFGAVHLGNGLGSGEHAQALAQSVAAVSTGLAMLAMRLRRGSVWPAVVYHIAWNVGTFGLDLAAGENGTGSPLLDPPGLGPQVAVALAITLPNGLYALWLMRRAGRELLPGDVAGPGPGGSR